MRIIKRNEEARKALLAGVELVYDCVCATLGPSGRNVSISRAWGSPIVVHDGVTVAKEVEAEDEFINQGVQLVKEAARKTNEETGDGTTTSTLLAFHIVDRGMKLINDGKNPMVLRKEIEATLPLLKEKIEKIKVEANTTEDIEKVATISSADEEIGKVIAEAVSKTGKDGLITVEESQSGDTHIAYTEGMQIKSGYGDIWQFINSPKRAEATIEDAAVVVLGKKVTVQREIVPLLEAVIRTNKNIVIFGDISGDALSTVVLNKVKGNFNCLVVDPPGGGDNRTQLLNDIAIYTGSTVITDELGLEMEQFAAQFDKSWVGSAKKVTSIKDATVIIEGGGTPQAMEQRIEQIKSQMEQEKTIYEKEVLRERLARLTTGVAIVKVWAKTDIEMRERVERVKDAVGSANAAQSEGIVPGGGVAFLKLAGALSPISDGSRLMIEVLHESIKKLLTNSGETPERIEQIIKEVKDKGGNFGYEVVSGKVVDMIETGVIDPAKVIRLSLENAISVAGSILTTDVLIVDKNEPQQQMING